MTAKVIIGMTTSLDGFVNGQDDTMNGMFADIETLAASAQWKSMIEQTGAVIMGKRTFEMGDPDSYVGSYEFQVPIFVLTHEPPEVAPKQDENLTFTFVTDGIESAVAQAKRAAGDKVVQVVGGPDVTRQVLKSGLADELTLDVMPVFFGTGSRLFDDPDLAHIQVEKIDVREVAEGGPRTMMRFRVK
ncbi:dihydrofolate reductase family protein [Amycolatopsis sp.]|jgi:dihydrofolate reductase|uniref:dihydrofolate reductase family protein n=1 Tax=Amycolatopsis sp. TaxID=37632 RepID=UPI002DFFAEEA|nr:dihydrofolate reductase family protein [Amycolatopsis sp.]